MSSLRQEATTRVHEVLDRGEHPAREDILESDTDALVRTQRAVMEFRVPHLTDCPWCRGEPNPEAALRRVQDAVRERTQQAMHLGQRCRSTATEAGKR